MDKIKTTAMVVHSDTLGFSNFLMDVINKNVDNGYENEVQYSTLVEDGKIVFTALVLGIRREKNNG